MSECSTSRGLPCHDGDGAVVFLRGSIKPAQREICGEKTAGRRRGLDRSKVELLQIAGRSEGGIEGDGGDDSRDPEPLAGAGERRSEPQIGGLGGRSLRVPAQPLDQQRLAGWSFAADELGPPRKLAPGVDSETVGECTGYQLGGARDLLVEFETQQSTGGVRALRVVPFGGAEAGHLSPNRVPFERCECVSIGRARASCSGPLTALPIDASDRRHGAART